MSTNKKTWDKSGLIQPGINIVKGKILCGIYNVVGYSGGKNEAKSKCDFYHLQENYQWNSSTQLAVV